MCTFASLRSAHVAALATIVVLPTVVVAASPDTDACRVPAATPLDQRVEQESQRGVPSFVRFINRTRTVFRLDANAEVAKIDARRTAERDCIARLEGQETAGADDPKKAPSFATAR